MPFGKQRFVYGNGLLQERVGARRLVQGGGKYAQPIPGNGRICALRLPEFVVHRQHLPVFGLRRRIAARYVINVGRCYQNTGLAWQFNWLTGQQQLHGLLRLGFGGWFAS